MNDFLFEILIQEMPYRFIPSAITQLEAGAKKLFCDNGLAYENIECYATPRRLALLVSGLADKQEDLIKDIRGASLTVALDDNGNYTPAALGFAKKNGVTPSLLYQKDGYIWAKIEQKGKTAKEILRENIENLVLNIEGAHFMRWKDNETKFTRPIENVLALFNNEILNVKIIDKQSSNKTQGLRFTDFIIIDNPKNYLDIMLKNNVIVNQNDRKQAIIELANKKAAEIDAVVHFDDDLLDEVTYLVEFPKSVLCDFDEKYLQIPDIVNVTVMAVHQRYFPLYDTKGKLLNRFITMANFVPEDTESVKNIQNGNKRVVAARLEDGIFFYNEDTKTPLEAKIENLKGMTFQKGLGSLYDKTMRIVELAQGDEDVKRCAMLCKADLATKLVFEFTELQGFIGENYALKSGEKPCVATGIKEHYFPLNAASEIATTFEGQIVGIADKIDTVCAVFLSTQENKKKRPTGSNDPLGVRRAVIGILRTVLFSGSDINLNNLIDKSLMLLSEEFNIKVLPDTKSEIEEFFVNRMLMLFEKEYPQNVMSACAKATVSPLSNLKNYFDRVKTVKNIDEKIIENAKRVSKIIPSNKTDFCPINENLFSTEEEKKLFETAKNTASAEQFTGLAQAVEKFFEKVLVMDNDIKIKENRISLLNFVNCKFKMLCDFMKL